MLKRILIYSIVTIFGIQMEVIAQRKVKYEELLPGILNSDYAVAVADLENLVSENPENPSMYLQLGLIYTKRFQESDPITGYKKAMANIKLAKSAFDNCERLLTDKEIKKNKEEYINFAVYDEKGKYTVYLDSIQKEISISRLAMDAFEVNMPAIYDDFTQSYSYYSKANRTFTNIISRHKSVKDLYLLYDQKMAGEFEEIKSNYLKSLEHFASYREKINGFDIGYNQTFKIDTISIYKLDGLAVEINFLEQKEILIWNYAKWVDDTKAYIDKNISALRQMMEENEQIVSSKINQVKQDVLEGKIDPLQVDKEFLFTLRKYDLKSVVEPIFLYKEKKHELLIQEQLNDISTETMKISPERQISHFGYLLSSIKKSDTLLQHVDARNTDFSYKKYKAFLDKNYAGKSGISQLVSNEKSINQKQFDLYLNGVRDILLHKYTADSIQKTVSYRRNVIPYFESLPHLDSLDNNRVTMHKSTNLDGSAYLGGIYKDSKTNLITAYVCRVESNHTISWYKDFAMQMDSVQADSHTIMAAMVGGQAGCTFILNGTHAQTGAKMNTFYSYSEDGKQLVVKNLAIDQFPRIIDFEEQTNTFLVGFSGTDYHKDKTIKNQIILANYNVIGDLLWKYNKEMNGDLIGVVPLEDGYLINGNYSSYQDQNGKNSSVANGYGGYLIKVNNSGSFIKERLLVNSQPYNISHFLKSGDHSIHVLGSTNILNESYEKDQNSLIHYIVNKDLDVVSSPGK